MAEVLLIGLGEIADKGHISALEIIPQANIVAGIDTDRRKRLNFRDEGRPVFQSVEQAIDAGFAELADMVVIATPTPTHNEIATKVVDLLPDKRLLVEKPLTDSFETTRNLFAYAAAHNIMMIDTRHYAFADEALWAKHHLDEWRAVYGGIRSYVARFGDPRRTQADLDRFSTSWLDLGINALSVLNELVTIQDVNLTAINQPEDYVADLRFNGSGLEAQNVAGQGILHTTWLAEHSSYISEFIFENGASLVLDHKEAFGVLTHDGTVMRHFEGDGENRRRVHYGNLYKSVMDPLFDVNRFVATSLRLYELMDF